MFSLYHNLNTADDLRCDGAGIVGAVRTALKMWEEERKAIVLQVILEKDHEVYYTKKGSVNENILLVEADGRVAPRAVREAAIVVKRFLQRTKETLGLLGNTARVDAALKNDPRLELEDQMQAVIDCLYADESSRSKEGKNVKETLSEICVELKQLGCRDSDPESIEGLAIKEMAGMAGYYLDAAEYVSSEVIKRVTDFVAAMLPEAKRVSKEEGLQLSMLEARVERAKRELRRWKGRLDAFDRGAVVNYEYPDGTPIRPVENREVIVGIIEENEKVIANGGKWW